MIPFKNRFHGHSSLNYVYKNGQAARSRLITVKSTSNKNRTESRIAVVVGKKVIKSAVKRNLIRRRVYEVIRLALTNLQQPYDIVIIVSSSEIISISNTELTDLINQLFAQSGIKTTK